MVQKALQYKIIRYGLTGGISTVIHISIAYLYIYFFDSSLFISNTLGFMVAFVFSYLVQSIYVFKDTIRLSKAIKYFIVQFSALLTAIFISEYLPLENSYIKTILVILILPLITYVIHKFWTFNDQQHTTPTL